MCFVTLTDTGDRSCLTENESEIEPHQIIHDLIKLLFLVVLSVDRVSFLNGLHVEQFLHHCDIRTAEHQFDIFWQFVDDRLHIGIDLVLLFGLFQIGILVNDEKYLFIKRFQVVHHLKESAEADIRQSELLENASVDQFQIALKGACHAHMVDDDTFKALCSFAQKRGFSDSALAVDQHSRPAFP